MRKCAACLSTVELWVEIRLTRSGSNTVEKHQLSGHSFTVTRHGRPVKLCFLLMRSVHVELHLMGVASPKGGALSSCTKLDTGVDWIWFIKSHFFLCHSSCCSNVEAAGASAYGPKTNSTKCRSICYRSWRAWVTLQAGNKQCEKHRPPFTSWSRSQMTFGQTPWTRGRTQTDSRKFSWAI